MFRINGTLKLPSNLELVPDIQKKVLSGLEKFTKDERVVFAVGLSLEEAVVNAMRHGNKLDPGKYVTVEYEVSKYKIKIIVTDEGEGFDLDSVPDPTTEENLGADHGRGILLMREYMHEVTYDNKGNKVILVRHF